MEAGGSYRRDRTNFVGKFYMKVFNFVGKTIEE